MQTIFPSTTIARTYCIYVSHFHLHSRLSQEHKNCNQAATPWLCASHNMPSPSLWHLPREWVRIEVHKSIGTTVPICSFASYILTCNLRFGSCCASEFIIFIYILTFPRSKKTMKTHRLLSFALRMPFFRSNTCHKRGFELRSTRPALPTKTSPSLL